MKALARYEAACRAVAEARSVDEARSIRDQAEAIRAYARQAKNKDMEIEAAEIRLRAERRLGELIAAQKATVGLNGGSLRRGSSKEPRDNRPTLSEAGIDKKLSSRAQKMAAVPEAEFEGMIGAWRGRVAQENERVTISLLNAGTKAMARAQKEAALAGRIRAAAAMLGVRRYGLIYADPPWRFEPRSRQTGMDRAADNHYPTMPLEEIEQLAVPAADHCILSLWATVPMLTQALGVMATWGFVYKSHLVWKKELPGNQQGTGYWFRNEHELLLIGTRGSVPAPTPGTQPGSVIGAPLAEHSAKPAIFREILEGWFPTLPRVELFAREASPGWDAWGAEAPVPEAAE